MKIRYLIVSSVQKPETGIASPPVLKQRGSGALCTAAWRNIAKACLCWFCADDTMDIDDRNVSQLPGKVCCITLWKPLYANEREERRIMKSHVHKINQNLVAGWLLIVGVLFVSYLGEVLKGERTLSYLIVFMAVTALPAFFCLYLYQRNPNMFRLRYYIIVGYFIMYLFSMMTGSTSMVFSYILPLLSLLVLYHQPKLILATGIASFIVNIIFIALKFYDGTMNLANSKDAEIQLALLALCFGGSYLATKLYDEITDENISYMKILDTKNSEIRKMTLQAITTIANTIDAKDDYTKGHSSRVSEYSAAVAAELGLSDEEVENIRSIALLHDIGKISVPDSVLNKPGKLTNEEYQLMKLHTTAGGKILKDIEMIPGIDIGAKYHHERYDGKGYPDGLVGEEIPFIARIIAIADAYDAMTSNRIYRKHLETEKVIQELENGVGTQFDPKAARALIRLLKEGRLQNINPDSSAKQDDAATTILSRVMKSNEEKVAGKILFDELTSAYNRNSGEKMMREILEEHSGCLMMFDLDHFRYINNTSGFIRGDIFLLETVKCIRELGNNSIISRFGGDAFVVLFQDIQTKEQAIEVAKHFFQIMDENRRGNRELSDLSVSVGIVYPGKIKESFSSLLLKVNKALYFAKQQGGNTYYIHNETLAAKKYNTTNVDMEHLISRIKHEKPDETSAFPHPETEQIYNMVQEITEKHHQVHLLMFTVTTEEGEHVSVEERDRVMKFLEHAITDSIRNSDATLRYSSTQQIVILNNLDEEGCHNLTEQIMTEFYKMYDRKEIIVHLDTADLSQSES